MIFKKTDFSDDPANTYKNFGFVIKKVCVVHVSDTASGVYTAKNATDLVQVVDFIGLMQVANKLYQAC